MFRRRAVLLSLLAALGVAACSETAPVEAVSQEDPDGSDDDGIQPERLASEDPFDPPAPPYEPPAPPCQHDGLREAPVVSIRGSEVSDLAAAAAASTHRCAPTVVVAPRGTWAATLAVPVALEAGAPLLLVDLETSEGVGRLADHLDGLDTRTLVTVGFPPQALGRRGTAIEIPVDQDRAGATNGSPEPPTPEGTTGQPDDADDADDADDVDGDAEANGEITDRVRLSDDLELALVVAEHLEVDRFVAVGEGDTRGRTAAALRSNPTTALLPVPDDPVLQVELAVRLPATARLEVVGGTGAEGLADELLSVGIDASVATPDRWPDGDATTWLVDPNQTDAGAIAAVAAGARGEPVLPIDATDLRRGTGNISRIRAAEPDRVVLVGELTSDAAWQLDLIRHGATLPGGALRQFEDERIVALYGSPLFPGLGALGEQDLDETVERLREATEAYDEDGMRVTGAFELIATIAATEPGEFGDYSDRTDVELLQPYVERAAAEGFQVILDLQPGRADFLSQAQEYEELLREPHVGLALDAEWRIGDDEQPLQRIGSVEVDEVQQVADWLAELTREHRLPQKLFVLHQFTDGMLPDRDELRDPPELATVIHMDGQGRLGTKYETYAAITAGAEDRWIWGWKNFTDEDEPVASPDDVLGLDPVPLLITYQ